MSKRCRQLAKEMPELDPRERFPQVHKEWKLMTPNMKQPYEEMAAKDREDARKREAKAREN